MHIAFRTSRGRGEYEVVSGAGGQPASGLEGWTFFMRWPDGKSRDTQLWLDPAGSGKPRLRCLVRPQYQIGRMVAAMLLLPGPRREMRGAATTLPIAVANQYLVTRIGFSTDTEFASPPERVTFEPNYVELANVGQSERIGVEHRWRRIQAVYTALPSLPQSVGLPLTEHQAILETGNPITPVLSNRVGRIIRALAGLGATFIPGHDPLPALEELAGAAPPAGPELPPPDSIGEDEIDVRVEAASEYRLARSRGVEGRAFAVLVKEAYRHRCAFCGMVLSGLPGINPGIDAAHILAWGRYGINTLTNGIALCKIHHWAFDAAIMLPRIESGAYVVRFTNRAEQLEPAVREWLGREGSIIPDEWLPASSSDRPSPRYLNRLYQDLGITFPEFAHPRASPRGSR